MPQKTMEEYFANGIIAPWYLRDDQLPLYTMLQQKKKLVVNTRRRWGKSTTVFTYIFERCHHEKIIVRAGGVTQKAFRDIFSTIMDSVYEKAPTMAPKYDHDEGCYKYPNGSKIFLFGMADKAEADKGRGALAHIIYCDEYGFWAYKAKYMLTSVLSPQVDTTDGQIIITSTPPEDLTHDYIAQISDAESHGYYFCHTIADSITAGVIDEEQHRKIIERCGGTETDAYQREYMCKLIASSERLVIPEAQDTTIFIHAQPQPQYFKPHVFIDLGLKDFACALFGYVDFKAHKLIIEKEVRMHYATTRQLTEAFKEAESTLSYKEPRRIGDNQLQQLYDMTNEYHYTVMPIIKAVKGEQSERGWKMSVINALRISIKDKEIGINPSCVHTITQLKYGIWNEMRSDFERTDALGHLDSLMTLAYFNYHVDWKHNPYPTIDKSLIGRTDWIVPKEWLTNKKSTESLWGKPKSLVSTKL